MLVQTAKFIFQWLTDILLYVYIYFSIYNITHNVIYIYIYTPLMWFITQNLTVWHLLVMLGVPKLNLFPKDKPPEASPKPLSRL